MAAAHLIHIAHVPDTQAEATVGSISNRTRSSVTNDNPEPSMPTADTRHRLHYKSRIVINTCPGPVESDGEGSDSDDGDDDGATLGGSDGAGTVPPRPALEHLLDHCYSWC